MFERFSEGARRSIVLAEAAARARKHDHVGTEHLLLGLIEEGSVATALASLEVSAEDVRTAVEDAIGRGETDPGGSIPFSSGAKAVLELALRETLEMGWDAVGPEHLLLALAESGERVAEVLQGFGVTGASVTRLIVARREPPPTAADEPWEGPRCPGCGEEVAVTAVYRQITVPDEDEDATRQVRVVFCRRCSRTLGVLPGG
jgi:ATP-dependent Clp protease ATP-binding subunit ClpA